MADLGWDELCVGHWGLIGIWIAFAADECLRGILMLLRWKSGKWREKSLFSRTA